jgi:hypothetical protein
VKESPKDFYIDGKFEGMHPHPLALPAKQAQ